MQTKLLVSAAAAIALVTGLGSATAGEDFATLPGVATHDEGRGAASFGTLAGVPADPLTPTGSSGIRGPVGLSIRRQAGTGFHSPAISPPRGRPGTSASGAGRPWLATERAAAVGRAVHGGGALGFLR